MVVINVEVANCPQSDVDQRVTGQLLEHVIEEPYAGLDVIGPSTIQIERNGQLRLGRLPFNRGLAHEQCISSWSDMLLADAAEDGQDAFSFGSKAPT